MLKIKRDRRNRRCLSREERRLRKEKIKAGVVLGGSILLAVTADGWADLILRAVGL